jgi:hypothetical protein
MSDSSRDFAAVATEPGLAMLDAQRVNYGILHKWIGTAAAEPELHTSQLVSFYVREEERGRLENISCAPATKKDLQGHLKEDFEELEQNIRKAKPESATEQAVHRIISKSFKELTADLDTSDFHHYFFKYKHGGEPWRLVWCWGYQRKDMEPARTLICTNLDCHQLFVHKPNGSKKCPACSTVPVKQRHGAGVMLRPSYLLIALILLLALFAWFTQPKLVITPNKWSGNRGESVAFQVTDKRWFFFETDVSEKATSQQDKDLINFTSNSKGRAITKGVGSLTFRNGGVYSEPLSIKVGAAPKPDSITIEPGELKVAIGGTKQIKVTGHYDDMEDLDLTVEDELQLTVKETEIAETTDTDLHGKLEGTTMLTAVYESVLANADVDVAGSASGSLWVTPRTVKILKDTSEEMKVESKGDGDVKITSSDESIAMVVSPDPFFHNLLAMKVGKAKITFTDGDDEVVVDVEVVPNDVQSIRIEPPVITAFVGDQADFAILGVRPDGTTVNIGPEQFDVLRQPPSQYADFDRVGISFFGLAPTVADEKLIVKYKSGDFPPAEAAVRVVTPTEVVAVVEDEWGVHPPLTPGLIRGHAIPGGQYFGDRGLIYRDGQLVVGSDLANYGLRRDQIITGIGGESIVGSTPEIITQRIAGLGPGGIVTVLGPDGIPLDVTLGGVGVAAFQDIVLNYAKEIEVSATDFRAELNFNVRKAGEYRVTDAAGLPLSSWSVVPAGSPLTLNTTPIPRLGAGAEYDIKVERKIGDSVTAFPITIKLEALN